MVNKFGKSLFVVLIDQVAAWPKGPAAFKESSELAWLIKQL